ncbi:MAG: AAA family ATPase [Elainellaceae cyanobacterium]
MNLFEQHRQRLEETDAPLAARMRPQTLDEFIGQGHIIGQGRLLRRAIEADQLSSVIFYGPPGTGKTTLARVIANTTKAHFISLNAVLSGVKDIREAIATAQERRGRYSQKTILFVDEVHRFNKAQQDALLPWVENGTVILIGATTENPYFEVNKALVSRSRVFQLKHLEEDDLRQVLLQAIATPDSGYGKLEIHIEEEAIAHWIRVSNGDARALLNALELAVETTPADDDGKHRITLDVAEDSIQQRAVLYDKEGDVHFDTISAFIKSLRGSDPDASLYWLARMVYAGEDPRYIFRRMVVLASEDVGLADPQAVGVVMSCAEAFDRVGMPEGRYPLAQAALYLATCPKSNTVMGFFDALGAVETEQEEEVPLHLRDANRDKHSFGHGKGYLYPHSYREHWVAQQYLPQGLQGQVFYRPSEQGYEQSIHLGVTRRREAQLAALMEGMGIALPEILTFSPTDRASERWLQRTLNQTGERLGEVRDRLFDNAKLQRHHVVIDLKAGSGLLTWEAVRRVPEGGVIACVQTQQDAEALKELALALPELSRPQVVRAAIYDLLQQIDVLNKGTCDRLIGRNVLMAESNKVTVLKLLHQLLHAPSSENSKSHATARSKTQDGMLVLAESIPQQAQRIYRLLDPQSLGVRLYKKLEKAEEAIYKDPDNPMVNWDQRDLEHWFQETGWTVEMDVEHTQTDTSISQALIRHWFTPGIDRPSYGDRLSSKLSSSELEKVQRIITKELVNQVVPWQGAIAYICARGSG